MMIISNKQQSPLKEPKRTKRVVKEWSEWTDPLSASEGLVAVYIIICHGLRAKHGKA